MRFPTWTKIWGLAFTYTLLIGLFIQLIVLKYIFPQWNEGAGMLRGLDSPFYHGVALALYQDMLRSGWGAWQLFPHGQVVSGISASFYYLIAPQPWSVLPLHAFLNASACATLFYLLNLLTDNQKASAVAILPFLLFPSALQWNAQLNNDVFSSPGVILFVTGWAALIASQAAGWRKNIFHLMMLGVGFFLIYLVRPYLGLPLIGISSLLFCIYLILFFLQSKKLKEKPTTRLWWLVLIVLLVIFIYPFASKGLRYVAELEKRNSSCSYVTDTSSKPWCAWKVSTWLPGLLDQQFKGLSISRSNNLRSWKGGTSNVDTEVVLFSANDVISYLPRALQISLLAPFPTMWGQSGSLASNTLMRRISGVEMSVVYLCLTGLLPAIFLWKKKPIFWIILLICGSFLLFYGLTIPNIGTLYRFRYPFLMCLVSTGLATWLIIFYKKLKQHQE